MDQAPARLSHNATEQGGLPNCEFTFRNFGSQKDGQGVMGGTNSPFHNYVLLDDNPTPEEVRSQLLSKREVSFEQQRAVQRQPQVQLPILTTEPEQPNVNRAISGGNLESQHSTSTRTSTAEYWRFARPTIIRLPSANKTSWHRRRTSSARKAAPPRRREFAGQRSSAAEYMDPVQKRNSVVTNRVTTDSSHKRRPSSLKRRSYRQNEGPARRNMTAPMIPSLHDPLKTGALADEWKQMLKDFAADNESSLLVGSTSITDREERGASPHLPSKPIDATEEIAPKRTSSACQSRHLLSEERTGSGGGTSMPGQFPSSPALQSSGPLDRDSSAVISDLASKPRTDQTRRPSPAQTEVVHGADQNQHQKSAPLSLLSLHNLRAQSTIRLPSARSVMSTDTLTGIEAHVQNERTFVDLGPLREVIEKPTSHAVYRHSGPPPKIPLPALPTEAQDDRSDFSRSSKSPNGMPSHQQSSASSEEFARHLIRGPRADKVRAQRLRDLSNSPRQSPKQSPMPSPESGASAEMKQNTLQSTIEADGYFPAPQSTFVADLARFPAVPDSRPTSLGSSSAGSHRTLQQSPGRNSMHRQDRASTAPASQPQKPKYHILSQSNIFVVVDSDPVTACFRASVGGNSPERRSSTHPTKPANFKEVPAHSKMAMQSAHGQQGQNLRLPVVDNKRPGTSEGKHQGSSSDERSLGSTGADSVAGKSARNKKRRRWNSSDIGLIKLLQRDLEDFYAKIREQEEQIKWQAHQIQMMNKGFAPVTRLQDVQAPGLLQDSPELPPMVSEVQPPHLLKSGSWDGPKERRQRNVMARPPLSIIKEQTLNTHSLVGLPSVHDAGGATVCGEAVPGPMEAATNGPGKRFTILHEPVGLIEDETDLADSRYYRSSTTMEY
ncbi:hypothetical protein H2200_012127 [Cladophialophora chaetospira]|uniref:Uncharacterized protein n=1 Tax=Cladophialophora chaetospira TaxID=386627 RepID=A0AA39CCL2_9EURO|nr:hypothetical protein H2200_012127 [Cladophialophora chaetospira]